MKLLKTILLGLLGLIALVLIAAPFIQDEGGAGFLDTKLAEVEAYIEQRDEINLEVSQSNVAWHLDHILKVNNSVYGAIADSDPAAYDKDFNLLRFLVLTTGNIPRGAGKAPESVRPPDNIRTEDMYAQLETMKTNLVKLEELDADSYMDHPVFGVLDKKQVKRFMKVHTEHHLKIIRDILGE
ncbi:MAG: DUF1569 domain-containing protein [Bacteroidota bacterium]